MIKTYFHHLNLKLLKIINKKIWLSKLGVKIGQNCRLIGITFSSEPYLVEIGNHVSATNVHFETHDGGVWVFRDKHPEWDIIKRIIVGNNVYIGAGSIILPGVTIGNNVVIGANSVVTRDLESNYVYAGVPAKKIKSIEEYYTKIQKDILETKLLTPKNKKRYLIKHFEAKQYKKY